MCIYLQERSLVSRHRRFGRSQGHSGRQLKEKSLNITEVNNFLEVCYYFLTYVL